MESGDNTATVAKADPPPQATEMRAEEDVIWISDDDSESSDDDEEEEEEEDDDDPTTAPKKDSLPDIIDLTTEDDTDDGSSAIATAQEAALPAQNAQTVQDNLVIVKDAARRDSMQAFDQIDPPNATKNASSPSVASTTLATKTALPTDNVPPVNLSSGKRKQPRVSIKAPRPIKKTRTEAAPSTILPKKKRKAAKPSKPLPKKSQTEAEPPKFNPPPGLDSSLIDHDLAELGFTAERKRELMAMDKNRQAWDASSPQFYAERQKVLDEQRRKRAERKISANSNRPKYEPLRLRAGSDWVLYDPNKTWPQHLSKEMPAVAEKAATFRPTHLRILAYNLKTGDVQIRGCPDALKGMTIEYTALGPKIKELREEQQDVGSAEESRLSSTKEVEQDTVEREGVAMAEATSLGEAAADSQIVGKPTRLQELEILVYSTH